MTLPRTAVVLNPADSVTSASKDFTAVFDCTDAQNVPRSSPGSSSPGLIVLIGMCYVYCFSMSLHVSGAGGPGSRKGALVEQLVSEFGAMLITADSLVQQMQTHESADEHIQSLPWSVRYCHV